MKRGGTLKRTTPLKRGGRMSPSSKARVADLGRRREVREAVFRRDGGCLADGMWGGCFGVLTPHHILKASQGGAYEMDNLITLCAFHNGLLEADAEVARQAEECGFVRRRNPR